VAAEEPDDKGGMVTYQVEDVSPDMSFLEMLDVVNERLTLDGDEPIAFDHDCREGICGSCGVVINGVPHGPEVTTTCQLHMRSFSDGDVIDVEPWRSGPFPVVKDLVVNRGAFDRIIQAGGFISAPTGSAPGRARVPVPKPDADRAFDAATCIQCGACVAACPNGSAMLFTAAKVTHLGMLPAGPARSGTNACSTWSASTMPRASVAARTSASAPRVCPVGHPARHDLAAEPRHAGCPAVRKGLTSRRR
jgi:succinate dehydrogenase / fumarate reductase iron-sulfur subunit